MAREFFLGRTQAYLEPPVLGDPISGQRYYFKRWAGAEWRDVFHRTWHIHGILPADTE